MIADLHAHYPMHLLPEAQGDPLELLSHGADGDRMRDRANALLVSFASRFANYESFSSGPSVTVPLLREGGVGVCLSVLYSFWDEFDLTKWRRGAPPDATYFPTLLRQLELVEDDLTRNHFGQARVAHDAAALEATLADDQIAFVHCVEGGFHLGPTAEEIDGNVAELAARGVAYVTLAHLIWRGVATNAPAFPFLRDWMYKAIFRQPSVGLTDLGRAAVRAMVRERVLLDVTHMSRRALDESFALLDELDPGRAVPVIASHMACRLGGLEYNLDDATIARIAERGGVMGVIVCEHYISDGIRRRATRTFEESVEALCRHIDRVHSVTGSHEHAAIGSDLDGFIKPTLQGLENAGRLAALEAALVSRYGAEDAARICSGNTLRVLRDGWR